MKLSIFLPMIKEVIMRKIGGTGTWKIGETNRVVCTLERQTPLLILSTGTLGWFHHDEGRVS